MSRTQGARDDPERAAKVLTDRAFQRGIRLTAGQLDTLDAMAYGKFNPRNSRAILGAIRTKMEWGHAKPAQEHELSGNVVIRVECAIPTRAQAKALLVANVGTLEAVETAELQPNQGQSPIMALMSTKETAAEQAIQSAVPADISPMLLPSVIEDGKLIGDPDCRTAEQRRADERAAWRAEQSMLGEAAE